MSLRISAPSRTQGVRRSADGEALEPDFYMSRLIKLIPAEAVAIYPMLQYRAAEVAQQSKQERLEKLTQETDQANTATATATSTTEAQSIVSGVAEPVWLLPAMAWLVLILVILLRWQATRDAAGNPQWGAVAIAAISFFLWVPTLDGGSFGILEFLNAVGWVDWTPAIQKFVPEVLLIFWTLLIPAFYKPEK